MMAKARNEPMTKRMIKRFQKVLIQLAMNFIDEAIKIRSGEKNWQVKYFKAVSQSQHIQKVLVQFYLL
jgi:hypothetical protein